MFVSTMKSTVGSADCEKLIAGISGGQPEHSGKKSNIIVLVFR